MTYAYGAAVRLTQEVRSGGELVTPTSITVTILLPDGTTDGPLIPTADSVGVYHYDYTSSQAGRHIARWETTGPAGAGEEPFDVAAQWSGAGIVSLAEAKDHLNITSTADDAELTEMIRAVTTAVERHAGVVLRRTITEEHAGGGYALVLHQTPVLAITTAEGMLPGVQDVAAADLQIDGTSGVVRHVDGRWIAGPVRVTYTAGRADVPANVRLAALMILQHLWESQRGSAVARFGAEEVWDPRQGFAVPRRALELLGEQVAGIA